MDPTQRLVVPSEFNRGAYETGDQSTASARWLIADLCSHLGVDDLSAVKLLDVGCGVKFSHVLLNDGVPVKRYVGVDVYRGMIEYLQQAVTDPRFEYYHVNWHNELYNPGGERFGDAERFPYSEQFDLITLFSVFTHLDPNGYRAMLKAVRRHAGPETRLIFSLYVDELTPGGHGLIDKFANIEVTAELQSQVEQAGGARQIQPFRDLDPSKPLLRALYSREHAIALIDGTGWQVVDLAPPSPYVQHHFICRPE